MRALLSALTLGLAVSGAASAQTPAPPAAPAPGSSAVAPAAPSLLTPQKVKSDLEAAGFTDVNVVAEAFVVQAKTKDGNPVVMTFGPHSFRAIEAIGAPGAGSPATGSPANK